MDASAHAGAYDGSATRRRGPAGKRAAGPECKCAPTHFTCVIDDFNQ